MSNLTTEEVEHIAKLANLTLTEEEKRRFASQLTEVLNYIEKISSVDTSKVSPLFNVIDKSNVFREDLIKPSLTQKQALANAGQTYKGYFKVKAVFGE